MSVTIQAHGTAETDWAQWLDLQQWPSLDLAPVAGRRVVVVAAHPDDEVLGAGGLLARLALDHEVVMVWATDGEGSHPGSTSLRPEQLAEMRREESKRALVRLGVEPVAVHHLSLPDSALAEHRADLQDRLSELVGPDDLVIANWSHDAHPDHEVVGQVAAGLGGTCWQYPVWLWHWANPADRRIPWDRLRVIDGIDVEMKRDALGMFVSQVQPIGGDPADAAILPPDVLEHFTRATEFVFA
ncbi:MAG TPA: PIG-L family deacetylase [Mycobacteriales bacterium]|nr:PIG-L family deacetylase [Mycobacteriales bacterium]